MQNEDQQMIGIDINRFLILTLYDRHMTQPNYMQAMKWRLYYRHYKAQIKHKCRLIEQNVTTRPKLLLISMKYRESVMKTATNCSLLWCWWHFDMIQQLSYIKDARCWWQKRLCNQSSVIKTPNLWPTLFTLIEGLESE